MINMAIDRNKILIAMARGKFSITTLAAKSGISRVTLSNIKNGKVKNLAPSTLGKLAEALMVDVTDLIVSEGSISSTK